MAKAAAQLPASGRSGAAGLPLRVRVTRPQAEAVQWVAALQSQGWAAEAHPLLLVCEPSEAAERQALAHWRQQWTAFDAVMFVSPAAVAHFFAAPVALPSGPRPRAWAPGPGTAQRLRQVFLGFAQGPGWVSDRVDAPPCDAPSFDSEHLWPVVAGQMAPGRRLLVVRGHSAGADAAVHGEPRPASGSGRDWLAEQCRRLGAEVQWCVAYERRAPDWSDAERVALAQGAADGSVWLFSSSEALAHLLDACAGSADGPAKTDWTSARALATHPRIAEAARQAGFGEVRLCRPALEDVLQALKCSWSRP